MSIVLRYAAAVGALALAAACAGSSPAGTDAAPSDSARLVLIVPPPASAHSGVPFAAAPVVELRDEMGHVEARAGVMVFVSIENSTGMAGPDSVMITTSNGRATFTGMEIVGKATTQRVTFSASGFRPVSADVALLAGPPARLVAVHAEREWAKAGGAVERPPSIRVSDGAGNSVAGVRVTFTPASGSGSVEHPIATSDAAGVASPGTWTLGATVGRQQLVAAVEAAGVAPLGMTAVALPANLRFERLASNADFGMCALTADGAGWCWGRDDLAQLGDSVGSLDAGPASRPVPIAGGLHLTQVSLGAYACALAEGGGASCWGRAPTDDGSSWTPSAVSGAPVLTAITVGGWGGRDFACGLDAAGAAYCWGNNIGGALGTGDTMDRDVPTPVVGGHRFKTIAAGGTHTCALTAEGTAFCWGSPLLEGDVALMPTAVPGSLAFASISASVGVTCGVTVDGKGYCWGYGGDGRLGDGAAHIAAAPSAVAGDITFASISAGAGESCGLATDGMAWCWGEGYLGDGQAHQSYVPVRVSGGLVFRALTTNTGGACALTADDRAYCWGGNSYGQAGNGTFEPTLVPVAVFGQD
ncbi:MAG: hypothetical protein HOQ12_14045 [Gemmatimonadaceae bacterium]|nr:hypothetical protein [Gemmatimonadaceae bacterium]NUQ93129.1 hypothetical protein [Gemmatimonadaceae bacterium]NUR20653.1 hypothetical protein [Gemmatimonadaceae bacterium]